MTVDINKIIDWYNSNKGKILYSMGPGSGVDQGPRQIVGYSQGGSTDCSGGMTSALVYAGAQPPYEVGSYPKYSTVNIGSYLASNGFTKVYSGPNNGTASMWKIKKGDIVNMGAGSIEQSAGSAGHIGVMSDANTFASVTFSQGWGGDAVQFDAVPAYFSAILSGGLTYFEVWRIASSDTPPTKPSTGDDGNKGSDNKKATFSTDNMWRYNDFIFGGSKSSSGNSKKENTADKQKPTEGSGGGGTHVYHWEEPRALTNSQRARLQTFPDSFEFKGSKEDVRKQIGMAVPCKGAKIIFEAILNTFAGRDYDNIPCNIDISNI